MVVCSIDGCCRRNQAHGYCHTHYERWRRYGDPFADNPIRAKIKLPSVCVVEGCDRIPDRRVMCFAHYQRWFKHGDTQEHKPITVRKGWFKRKKDGYIIIPAHGGSVFEHVKVMSETLGRPLLPKETVHHRNGIRDDNRPQNLELWSGNHPTGARVSDQIRWALKVLQTYGSDPNVFDNYSEGASGIREVNVVKTIPCEAS